MTRLASRFASFVLLCLVLAWPSAANAYSSGSGINFKTYREVTPPTQPAGCTGGGCHAALTPSLQVQILGVQTLGAGDFHDYTIRARRTGTNTGARMGFVVAAHDSPQPLDPRTAFGNATRDWATEREVSHGTGTYNLNTSVTVNEGGQDYETASYTFRFTMPSTAVAGSEHKLDAAAVLGFGYWNHAATFKVYVPPSVPTNASHSNVGSASATISWSGGGPRYRVLAKSGSAPSGPTDPGAVYVDVSSGTSATITGLTPNTSLYYAAVYSRVADADVFSTSAATTGPFTTLNTQNTTTAVASSLNPALVGNTVTFTATVTTGVGTPVGSVTFKDGAAVICASVALSGGQAQCATSALTAGTHSITAEYSGATGYFASTSSALSQEVRVPAPRYVNAATGANTGDCLVPANPCKTITYAMSQAFGGPTGGDSIVVAPGTYNVALGEVFPIVFKSGVELYSTGTPANTIIDGAGDTVRKGLITAVVGGGGRIEGFTLTNGVHEANQITQGGAVRIFGVSTGSFTVTRNVFSNNEARGGLALGGALYVSSTSGSGSISITNNVFVGNVARGFGSDFGGNAEGGGVYFEVPVNGSATNNTFHGNSAIGRNNSGVPGGDARGGGAAGNSTLTIVNNIFSANSATAGTGSPAGTATAGAAAAASGSSSNNLTFGNLVNGAASTGDSLGSATVAGDPKFHSAPSNLRILSSSAAKAAGTATGAPITDHDGTTRPNPPSIGAFESSDTVTYNLVLEGYQQVGPYVATTATGSGTAIFNVGTKQLTFNLPYSGLSGAETGAHIHGPAARGANAGVLVSLSGANPKADVVTLTASQETQLYAGQLYVNIHTSTYPNGELRAQIDGLGAASTRVLTVTKSGTGTGTVSGTTEAGTVVNCGSDCSETVPTGKVVTLTATPSGSGVFIGWSGACTGTGQCQVTMDASKSVDANFFSVVPRYVNAATGTNSGNCASSSSPCKTITYAMSQASSGPPGDPINVAPGTYNVGLGEVFPIQFKSGVELVATGAPANTVIDAAGDAVRNGIFIVGSPSGGRIEGFTLANGVNQASGGGIAQGGAMRIYSASGFTVTRNVFSGNEARGENNGLGLALGGALYASFSTGIAVTNNVFVGNTARGGSGTAGGTGEGGGIYFDSVTGSATNNTFRGNSAIGGNGSAGSGGNARGGGAAGNSTLTIVNNIFSANAATAGTGSPAGTATAGAAATGSGSSSNNLSFGNLVNGAASTGDALGSGTVTQDPQFLSAPTNLRIPGASPAAGAGTATGAPTTDHDGATRPNPPSIGAFEPTTSITYNLVLEGYQQVGPYVATAASGSGTAVFNTTTKQLTFNLAYSGLSSAETGAHIHGPAARGANAGVLISLSGANPKQDVVTLTASQETQLYAGQLYVNIHTSTYGAGELRAQIDNAGATVTRQLTVTKSGPGSGMVTGSTEAGQVVTCGSDCAEAVPAGKVVTLSATPTGSSVFVGWSGACTGTGQCQVTMDAAKSVDANFFAVVPRYVNASTGANSSNCSSSSSPCKTITYAMGQASAGAPGDAINVAPGTYNAALGEVFPIVIKSGVQLQSTGTAANTTIDATGASQRVLQMATAANSSTLLQGFTITGGLHAPAADGSLARGGGLYIDGGSPTIRRNVFLANEARGYNGTGVTYQSGGEAWGGAIYVTTGTPTIVNNVFRGNIARGGIGRSNPGTTEPGSSGGGGYGGAIYVQTGPGGGAINNNTFYANSAIGGNGGSSLAAGGQGGNGRYGALHSTGLSVNNNIFAGNMAIGGDGGGGSPAGTDGTASYGAMQYNSPPADASNNLFHGNTTDGAASTGDTIGTSSRCFLSPGCTSVNFHAEPANLRILPSSPAAGTGTATGAPSDDFDGITRASPPSIGAYEPSSLAPTISLSATSVDFGGQSMGTTSPPIVITLTNTGNSTLAVSSVSVSNGQFAQGNNCSSVAAGASCTFNTTFTPAAAGGAINSTVAVSGTLSITSNASGSPHAIALAGTAEKSLVSHYYRSILRRAPDAGGKAYWQGEAARVANLGANVNEVWFALSGTFYTSPEYLAQNRNNTGFVTDLYNTFFNRAPDSGGLAYWTGQVDAGMPREVLLAQFMFSPEFNAFTAAIFGTPATRAEVNMVIDFYRGILGRLVDDGGFNYWLQRFRAAQCQGPAGVTAEVEAISSAFTLSGEYTARGRNTTQYVGDLYNAFLRRGGDLQGVQYWINEIESGRRSREDVRVEFKNSPEFQVRVNAIIQQGCTS